MSTGSTETNVATHGAAGAPASLGGQGVQETDAILCTECSEANVPGSRFCRSCGAALGVPAQGQGETTVFDRAAGLADVSGSAASTSGAPETAPAPTEDTKKARQLLDRAFTMFERGDLSNAILSCRQSVALAPHSAQGFSMLGLLLERTGDLEEAAAAYARVLRLAPSSRKEAESLERIRSVISERRGQAPAFRFNEQELDEALAGAAVSASAAKPILDSNAKASAAASTAATTPVARDVADVVSQMPASTYAASSQGAALGGLASPSVSALHFDALDAEPEPWWKRVAERPTAFSRGLPVATMAGLSLLLLIWARGAALSRYPQDSQLPASVDSSPVSTGVVPPVPAIDPARAGSAAPEAAPVASAAAPSLDPNTNRSAAYPVSNRPGVAPNPAPVAPSNVAPGTANPSTPGTRNTGFRASQPAQSPLRSQPSFPPATRVVPPIYPGSLPSVLPAPAQSVPSVSLPSQDGGITSAGGGPLGPVSSSRNPAITLTRPRPATSAVSRPSASRTADENAAALAARAGRPDVAIGNLNRTIRNGGEAAWTYQQRALAFVERGDYQRAADDFQAAISAYRDQIARGERVEEARAGVAACQSGLNLALQNLRR
jgi:tetratricopeptide (TPR) repeat protein